jgi:hypothetical protein
MMKRALRAETALVFGSGREAQGMGSRCAAGRLSPGRAFRERRSQKSPEARSAPAGAKTQ